jgi:hypothetical protein
MSYATHDSAHVRDNDLDRAFGRFLEPQLDVIEEDRNTALAERQKRLVISALVLVPLLAGSIYGIVRHEWSVFWVTALNLAGGIGAFVWLQKPVEAFETSLRDKIMTVVCHLLGKASYDQAAGGFNLSPFDDAHLLSSYNRQTIKHHIKGSYRNCTFELAHAELKYSSGKSSSVAFDGLLLSVSVPRVARGKIIIVRDWGAILNQMAGWFTSGERVKIPNEDFESKYEVYAENQAEAVNFITPTFVRNFLALREMAGSDNIVAAFDGPRFLLAINDVPVFLDGFFASTPATELRDSVAKIAHEVTLVHRIIDQLHSAG